MLMEKYSAIADKVACKILLLIINGINTTTAIANELGVKKPSVSRPLKRLREENVVTYEINGTKRYYNFNKNWTFIKSDGKEKDEVVLEVIKMFNYELNTLFEEFLKDYINFRKRRRNEMEKIKDFKEFSSIQENDDLQTKQLKQLMDARFSYVKDNSSDKYYDTGETIIDLFYKFTESLLFFLYTNKKYRKKFMKQEFRNMIGLLYFILEIIPLEMTNNNIHFQNFFSKKFGLKKETKEGTKERLEALLRDAHEITEEVKEDYFKLHDSKKNNKKLKSMATNLKKKYKLKKFEEELQNVRNYEKRRRF